MFFVVLKLLKFGASQAKKHRDAKDDYQQHQQQQNAAYPHQTLPNGRFNFSYRMPAASTFTDGGSGPGIISSAMLFAEAGLRFVQFVMALAVVGLYGKDINFALQEKAYADPKWVYAMVLSVLAALTAMVLFLLLFILQNPLPFRTQPVVHFPLFLYECALCVLWLTLFGIFGKMYIGEDPEGDTGIVRMKHAVWVDLANLGLWIGSATWVGLRWRRCMRAVANAQLPDNGGTARDAEKAES
ncbi:hypothetical protein VTN00DRAFT_1195 [Thermoascus crustaceus]|uniref:uncharacterized protein n=1 Tax=Thermoascus crustaceus TaxID=5088 RepID=UPI0037436F49